MKLYAFWRCSHFPFLLGGRVSKILKNGTVETENYLKGDCIKILPLKKGLILQQRLDALRQKHCQAETEFRVHWINECYKLIATIESGK